MPWWTAIIIGAASVFAYGFFKTLLKKCNMKPIMLSGCAFVLTMLLTVVIAYAIRYIFFTPHWE